MIDLPPIHDPQALRAYVRDRFGLVIPARRLCDHHDSPWDYVSAALGAEGDLTVWANRGGGKSMLAALATVLEALVREGTETVILGGSQEQSDRVAQHVREMLARMPQAVGPGSTKRRLRLRNGSVIHVLAQSETSVRGIHADRVRCDEVELFDPEVWRAVQFCTTGKAAAVGALEAISTAHVPGGIMERLIARSQPRACGGAGRCSRPDPRPAVSKAPRLIRWCLWEVIERCPPERRCGECPLWEDCRGRARQAEGFFKIDDAIAIQSRSSRAAWETEMLCRGARRERLVFGEFDPAVHVGEVGWCADFPTYRAIDFGYAEPLVCLWIQLTPTGTAHVIDEYVQPRRPIAQHAVEILRRDPPGAPRSMPTYVDPAGRARESTSGAACTELLAAAGIRCCWRSSTIAEGLELIRAALAPASGPPRLKIAPRCRRLIEAFRTYRYAEPGSGPRGEKPLKDGPDHLIDALRYFFVNRMRPGLPVRRATY